MFGSQKQAALAGMLLWEPGARGPSSDSKSCLSRSGRQIFFPEDRGREEVQVGMELMWPDEAGDLTLRTALASPDQKDEYFCLWISGALVERNSECSERESGPNQRCLKKFDK